MNRELLKKWVLRRPLGQRWSSDTQSSRRSSGPSSSVMPAADNGFDLRKLLARQLLPLGFAITIMALLWDQLEGLDVAYIRASLQTVQPHQWLLAALLTAVSFWAVGRYDRVVHRLIGTQTPSRDAQLSGVTAIALSQTVGFGVISSALVRWRMVPDLSLFQALRISMIVALSFLSAWAVVTALALLFIPLHLPETAWISLISWAALSGATLFITLSLWRPTWMARFNVPSLRAMAAFVGLAALDTIAAGAALWAVLPENCSIALLPLIAAYLVALGVGLISGTPGGVGPFEVTLLALLPHLDQEPVLAAILAFRAVYYAVPAVIAAAVTLRGPRAARPGQNITEEGALTPISNAPQLPGHLRHAVIAAPRGEAALLRQGNLSAFAPIPSRKTTPKTDLAMHGMGKLSAQSLILLSDPFQPAGDPVKYLQSARTYAAANYRSPFLYKISARFAAKARAQGWKTLAIAREAWITPAEFSTEGPSRRQLRRKLRQAEKAGITATLGGSNLPIDDMQTIADLWRSKRGGERGFSMGVWNPATLPYAQVVLAYQHAQLIGFITLHKNGQEQVLDLMRMHPKAPDGTMHLLVCAALKQAAKETCPRLSLAAVPLGEQESEPRVFHHLRNQLDQISGAAGLRQFKTCFDPNWETLYAASPTRSGLVLGAMDVMREIARPKLPGRSR